MECYGHGDWFLYKENRSVNYSKIDLLLVHKLKTLKARDIVLYCIHSVYLDFAYFFYQNPNNY